MLIVNKTFCVITLGCRTNICESNDISNQLKALQAIEVQDLSKADICIINTCCVTNKAQSKSCYFINKAIRSKKCKLIIIVGCLAQINPNIIKNNKIGIVIGSKYKSSLGELIKKYNNKEQIVQVERFNRNDQFETYKTFTFDSKTRGFIKIQDGCDMMCSYCVIPLARGRQRSLHHKIIINMIKQLRDKNVKEIILTGVNTAGYREKSYTFLNLLQDINRIPGNFRVRISSLEPFQINHKIINLILKNKQRWCQHLHICLQSAENQTLSMMKRHYSVEKFINLCKYIKGINKYASITTDCIVGFPTETDEQFKTSLKNIKIMRLSDIHIFPFSCHAQTVASKLKNIVSDIEKRNRCKQLECLKYKMQNEYLKIFKNKIVNVLFEKSNNQNIQVGHSEYFFKVYVKTNKNLTNKLLKVKIVKLDNNQLFGTIA